MLPRARCFTRLLGFGPRALRGLRSARSASLRATVWGAIGCRTDLVWPSGGCRQALVFPVWPNFPFFLLKLFLFWWKRSTRHWTTELGQHC